MSDIAKSTVDDLALFGGNPLFAEPKSTSSLVQPDVEDFLEYCAQSYEAAQFTNNGPNVRLLEERLARFHGAENCIAFCSGFWAIVLTIKALARPGKTEIAMPSLTYRRMADIAAWVQLKPRFCEVEEETLALSARTLEPILSDDTAIIMAVHPIVNCCDVDGISALASDRELPLVFDSVESVFESIPTGKVGSFGDAECFSMHASKLLNGFEGGYVTTNNEELAVRLTRMRTFGFVGPDSVGDESGMNAKLCEFHAAMGLANLDRLEDTVSENEKKYRIYADLIENISGLELVRFDETNRSSFKNIVFRVNDDWPLTRDEFVKVLNAEKVLSRAYYSPPLHLKPMQYPFVPTELPVTESLADQFITMPCGAFVTEADIQDIMSLLVFVSQNGKQILDRIQGGKVMSDA